MIFGFGKKRGDDDEDDDEQEEVEYVLFQGALNGKEANLAANARLAQAGLVPAKEIVTDAILRRADQLRIEPKGERALVQITIDGIAYAGGRLSKQQGHAVTQMMKLLSGLDTQQRQKPQAGGLRAELEGKKYVLRVVSTPVAGGAEKLLVKIRDLSQEPTSAEEVGITPGLKAQIRELTSEKHGLILICGPPGSGVSTTTFAVLRSVDAYQYTVYMIGENQGWELPNVNDFERNEDETLDGTLDRAIRAESDVMYVDTPKDAETAATLIKRQRDTAIVFEFPARDAYDGVTRFIKLAGNPAVAAEAIAAAMSQRLIRTLCKDCKMAYRPNATLLKKIGLPPETKTLYRPAPPPPPNPTPEEDVEPCGTCGGTGYFGRAAMFELLMLNDATRKVVAAGGGAAALKASARSEKAGTTLQSEGLRLVVEGRTSLEELQRAFKPTK